MAFSAKSNFHLVHRNGEIVMHFMINDIYNCLMHNSELWYGNVKVAVFTVHPQHTSYASLTFLKISLTSNDLYLYMKPQIRYRVVDMLFHIIIDFTRMF